MVNIKYPDIKVKLSNQDGNAFNLLGITTQALRKNKVPEEEVREFLDSAKSDDYYHLISVITDWVTVE